MRRRLTRGSRRFLVVAGALTVLFAQTGPVAAAESWTVTANPTTIIGGSSGKVRLTFRNTSSTSSNHSPIGCLQVTIPRAFTIGTPSIVSVTNGLNWSVG